MPALRGVSAMAPRARRRSSIFSPAKAGIYAPPSSSLLTSHSHSHAQSNSHPNSNSHSNAHSASGMTSSHLSHLTPRPISFAPNVTPVTFTASSSDEEGGADLSDSNTPPLSPGAGAQAKLFPPSSDPAPPPQRKRCPPGKRRSQGYIPRPPNAFMLFRADFVRQKHVPGSIETNHGSLSKIIGNCWRSLPLDEKKVWETKAKHEKAAHKIAYPHYRFKPVHNKGKKKGVELGPATALAKGTGGKVTSKTPNGAQESFEEEMRCEEVTQLLLQGLKGEELTTALRELEKRRQVPSSLDHQQLSQLGVYGGGEPGVYGQDGSGGGYGEGVYGTQDPYGHQEVYAAQQEAFGGGSYVDYSRGATPSTAGSIPFTAMSAPQPTYPVSSVFGLGGGVGGGGGQPSLFMQRRPSSVPAIPTNFGMGWAQDFAMQDEAGVGGYGAFHAQQQQQQAATRTGSNEQGTGIDIPSVPFLPPPSSAGPVPMISGFASAGSSSASGFPSASSGGMSSAGFASSGFAPSSSSGLGFAHAPSSTSSGLGFAHAGGALTDAYGHRMSLSQRMAFGQRRSSSAGAAFGGMRGQGWGMGMGMGMWGSSGGSAVDVEGFSWPPPQEIQRDERELPEADLSLFNPSFLSTGTLGVQQVEDVGPTVGGVEEGQGQGQGQQGTTPSPQHCFTTSELYQHLPQQHQHQQQAQQELGPLDLDSIAPNATVVGGAGHGHTHSSHPSMEGVALQFQPGLDTSVQFRPTLDTSSMGGGQQQQGQQQGQRDASPVEQYEQMYLAERGQYGVGTGMGAQYEGGVYDMAAYAAVY